MPANEERICTLLYTNCVEIIAEILEMDNEFISIKAPFRIVQVQHQGQVGLTFVPAIISADENEMFATPFSSLMFLPIKAKPEFKQKYMELTSGIALPPQSIITG